MVTNTPASPAHDRVLCRKMRSTMEPLELGGKADARTAGLLGTTSREAMRDLREIICVLDADPRPKSVPELVECSRLTGMRIESRVDDRLASLPKTLSDAAYRTAQEALTKRAQTRRAGR